MKLRIKFIIYIIIFTLLFAAFGKTGYAFQFNKNFLISDADFNNFNAMNAAEIENFLVAHNSFLASYSDNGKSAADIIYEVAQKYKINPEVILTTMQKEEGLITKTSYDQYALNFAMGYHSLSSFYKQVNDGTKLLRDGFDYLAEEYGWKVGSPHATEDDPKYIDNVVTPENRATAALYLYTPYIGGYYTDSNVFIGGNFIFVKIYSRWFGESKRYPLEFTQSSPVFYVPEGKESFISICVKNVSKTPIKKGAMLVALDSSPLLDIDTVETENDLMPGQSTILLVRVPPVAGRSELNFAFLNSDGAKISLAYKVILVPVSFQVNTELSHDELNFSVKNLSRNIEFCSMSLRVYFKDTEYKDYPIVQNSLFQKSSTVRKGISLKGLEVDKIELLFFGANFSVGRFLETVVFQKLINSDKCNLSIETVPGDAYAWIDEKLYGLTPIIVSIVKGMHNIKIKKDGFKEVYVRKEIDVDTNLNIKLNPINGIIIFNSNHLTNNPEFTIRGKVEEELETKVIFINGESVPLNSDHSFVYTVILKEGKNVIHLQLQGSNVETDYSIVLDDIPPVIELSEVPEVSQNLFVKFKVKAVGASKLFVDGKLCSSTECTSFIRLNLGMNKVTITAEDEAGNKSEKSIFIKYTPLPPKTLALFIGKKIIYVNGFRQNMDVAPIIVHSRTMLPVRFVVEALGGTIFYKPVDKTVHININGAEIVLTIGDSIAVVNGDSVKIDKDSDVKPFIKNGRTFLPLRFIVESIGGRTQWIPQQREVLIFYPDFGS